MNIKIIAVQKHKDQYIQDGIAEYEKRLTAFGTLEWSFIKEEQAGDDIERTKKKEAERILAAIPSGYSVVALDVAGTKMSSEEFSAFIEQQRDFEGGRIAFVIGGPYGLGEEVLTVANKKISFSEMTMTHQMVRLFLVEQLYRAFTIIAGTDYHK